MRFRLIAMLSFVFAVIAASAGTQAVAVEPWADPRLKVTQGLEFWFDAARSGGGEPVGQSGKVAIWKDASGHGHDIVQKDPAQQPAWMKLGPEAIVRFDGRDDFLRIVRPTSERNALTIFIAGSPRYNMGGFAGVLATNAKDRRDYESGITIDQGPTPAASFAQMNVEGRGFGAWKDLMTLDRPFGKLEILTVAMDAGQVALLVDGKPAGSRPRIVQPISVAELTLGARYYENGTGPQRVQGFGAWDIAEVLVFARSLSADETRAVNDYLAAKYGSVRNSLPADPEAPAGILKPIADPPIVQTLLPGFEVRELPLELTNVNNVLYRPDGTLMALAYDGRIWSLRDTDGDGLEDKADLFWDGRGSLRSPVGMDVTPVGYRHGDGVVVVSKSKCVLVVDTDKDGKGDREIVVADGWKDKNHQIDGIGVAIDKRDGAIYFGRGTADYTNGYLKDKSGKARFELTDPMGTIQRVEPDFRSRSIVATGVRFTVALRFDRHGELFATDQEGATWLANGNPFDELLHIRKGRHYGFPPRHPEHLPNVIDEPSVFDYAPQHQSVCGFAFNEPVKSDGPVFGPQSWAGDAFVTGESRGKLFRTKLVLRPSGYVGQTSLFAALSMLTVDCCVAPDGSLRVACHSGGPDWGSGPTGRGKILRIRYADREHPQPVGVWPVNGREIRVEFDRPLESSHLKNLTNSIRLEAGPFVSAGDRFESLWPGYAVVAAEKLAGRRIVPVRSVQLTPDRRALVIATDGHAKPERYALTLPGMGRPPRAKRAGTDQLPEIDLAFDLSGCMAEWTPANGDAPAWSGWLPHADLNVARALTAGSAWHEALWQAMKTPGELKIRTRLDLARMLRPAVQPGATLDHVEPGESVTVRFESNQRLAISGPAGAIASGKTGEFTIENVKTPYVETEIRLSTDGGEVQLTCQFATAEDPSPRALPIRRFLVPWSATREVNLAQPSATPPIPELAGGSRARGAKVFFGEEASCAKCHGIDGRGGNLGPDLSNLRHRDYASVLRDIADPSFAINPDHLSSVVELKSGQVLVGIVRYEQDRLTIGDSTGREIAVNRAEIERVAPSPVSIMPAGLDKVIGPEKLKDLMTFLLAPAPSMPDYGRDTPPPPRRISEVQAVLAGAPEPPLPVRKLHVVLVAGRKDHGPGEHDYPAWRKAWADLFALDENLTVDTADTWPTPDQMARADVLVFYQQGNWNADRARAMDTFFARGGGAVYLHYAVDGGSDPAGFADRIGLAWKSGQSKFRHGPLALEFAESGSNPITRNFGTLSLHDESYWKLAGDLPPMRILASGQEEGAPQPLLWTAEPGGKGRVFVSIPGHYSWTFDDPLFRILVLRGMAWTAREPVDRFDALVLPGARIAR